MDQVVFSETTLDTANHVAVRVVMPGDRPVLHERNGHVLPASITRVTVGRKIVLGTGVSTKSIKPKKKDSKGGNRTMLDGLVENLNFELDKFQSSIAQPATDSMIPLSDSGGAIQWWENTAFDPSISVDMQD
ncbi:hypothetical protein V6N13_099889 [Hibiscus sabdariffa]|uniref:Uncharacterized protein n=1 Tax=Hibiscus sabdariffa TaxID=183260 RepID=A0ABR2NLN5_9ROSI